MSQTSHRIIVTGLIGQYPLGGVAWDYIQYVLGLRQLGHDVYYFEDTGQSPYVPPLGGLSDDYSFTVNYLETIMARFGLEDRWAYHFPYPTPQWFGLSDRARAEVISTADLLINVSGTLARPQDYKSVRRLVFLDSDPAFTQVKLARGQKDFKALVDSHDVHFSFGETLPGNVPDTGHNWLPTRQPVVLPLWRNQSTFRNVFTTVMNWTSYNPIEFAGVSYGQKNEEFTRFLELPSAVAPTQLESRSMKARQSEHLVTYLLSKGGASLTLQWFARISTLIVLMFHHQWPNGALQKAVTLLDNAGGSVADLPVTWRPAGRLSCRKPGFQR